METDLAATAAARKERLIALRKRKDAHEHGEKNGGPSHFTFKQRNFDPETRQVRQRDRDNGEDTVEKAVEGLAEEIIKEDELKRAEELDLFNIQPKRVNWDLKRDLNNRMMKLERKTNEAISVIFRSRLQSMKKDSNDRGVDLVASINAAEHERDQAAADAEMEGNDSD
ncbi:coiled-coil domain-containing protein 12 [Tremella mesenterica]|uniref:Coiled-coil domain-containing protein 12 n=1 Tax=Tremella mesenterica TaxID=5217 RepID=A0A4Q1BUR0_TREME|nr:uncharacterized protein TREMEDRAFT_43512 [Tremella mesenterica DSM 1558]EIW69856.1 hypothetical protein TREMEDRAFT_43512 [Tremella mesenterica DSM 1558]RXK41736.1 coiled-coil domain-containing protein 12 [Tremella mesenterica]